MVKRTKASFCLAHRTVWFSKLMARSELLARTRSLERLSRQAIKSPGRSPSTNRYSEGGLVRPHYFLYSQPVMRTPIIVSSFVVVLALIGSQVILAFDNNQGLNYLTSISNASPSEQDWSTMALAAYGKTSAVSNDSDASVTSLSRQILARVAQRQPSNRLVTQLKATYQNNQFSDSTLINDDMFAILALAGADPSWSRTDALTNLVQAQNSDGGFNFRRDGASNTDMTAAALWALAFDTGFSTNKDRAWQYLGAQKNSDDGYGSDAGNTSNLDTTSWVIIALHRYGRNARTAEQYLRHRQNTNGSWSAGNHPSVLSTAYAMLALSGKTLPFKGDFSTKPSVTSPNSNRAPAIQNNQPATPVARGQPNSSSLPSTQPSKKSSPKVQIKKSTKSKISQPTSQTTQISCYAQATASASTGNGEASAIASAQAWCE